MTSRTFKGTYSDLKLIRSRKVATICIEIPLEGAAEFVRLFGMPDPAEEKWIALALIGTEAKPEKEKRPFSELPPAQQAALACKREAFQRFLVLKGTAIGMNEISAADSVRGHCDIASRSELTEDPIARALWVDLYDNFQLWLGDPDL